MTIGRDPGRRKAFSGEPLHGRTGTALLLVAAVAFLPACREKTQTWGEVVDPAAALSLAQLPDAAAPAGDDVTVSGEIGEVCRSSGCWFVLRDVADGSLQELLVDLKPRADFTLPRSVLHHHAVVRGRLVGAGADRKLEAVGLRVD
jgi:hypothetical protein